MQHLAFLYVLLFSSLAQASPPSLTAGTVSPLKANPVDEDDDEWDDWEEEEEERPVIIEEDDDDNIHN